MIAVAKQKQGGNIRPVFYMCRTATYNFSASFVARINLAHRQHTGVFLRREIAAGFGRLAPIWNATGKRGNQRHTSLGAGVRPRKTEHQGEVAVDAFALDGFSCPDAFPCGCDHAVASRKKRSNSRTTCMSSNNTLLRRVIS